MEGGSSCYSAGRDIGWHGYVVLTTECLAGRLCEGSIVLFVFAFVVDVTYRVLPISSHRHFYIRERMVFIIRLALLFFQSFDWRKRKGAAPTARTPR